MDKIESLNTRLALCSTGLHNISGVTLRSVDGSGNVNPLAALSSHLVPPPPPPPPPPAGVRPWLRLVRGDGGEPSRPTSLPPEPPTPAAPAAALLAAA